MVRVCKECGIKFETTTPRQRLCEKCRNSRTRSVKRARELRECVCVQCGKTFWGRQGSKFCQACNTERKADQRVRAYKRKCAGKARAIGSIDICQMCGGEYIVNGGAQKFCPECGKKRRAENIKKFNVRYWRENKNRLTAQAFSNTVDSTICRWCGKAFTASHDNFTTCSPECAKKYKAFLNKKHHATYAGKIKAATWLIDARKSAGLSQKELAEKIGVTKNSVSNWECGCARPSAENLAKLHDILGAFFKEEG